MLVLFLIVQEVDKPHRTSEAFFDLLDKLSEGNQRYEGDTSRTTNQNATGILDVDQATTLNAKIDAMQNSMTIQFKQLDLNQASINVMQQVAD